MNAYLDAFILCGACGLAMGKHWPAGSLRYDVGSLLLHCINERCPEHGRQYQLPRVTLTPADDRDPG